MFKPGGDGAALLIGLVDFSQYYFEPRTYGHRYRVNTYIHIEDRQLFPIQQCIDCGYEMIHDM